MMKKLAFALAGLVLAAGAAAADPIEGTWKTQVDDGNYAHVRVVPCGAKFCGVISRTFNGTGEYKSENIGKQLVRGMTANGDGSYEGKVWRPSNNKVYLGKATVSGNSMLLKGCVAGGLFCAKQNWTRVK